MTIKYKYVIWLSVIMTAFFYIPFWVQGWSTDVFTRLIRIVEWVEAGFPWKEQLLQGQNYPFGHEMHWTRPLDWVGYLFAWPFIPNWGLKKALEIMTYYVPVLVLISGVLGFYYGIKGYLKPLMALLVFVLFFYGFGYAWGQATVGYYDHHVFHFSLLVWTLACVLQWFRNPKNSLLIWTGVLLALGTWILFEFFINIIFISIPFFFLWLFYNKSLKPLMIISFSFIITLFLIMTFDHPIAGFLTLDFTRASIFHCILGLLFLGYIVLLDFLSKFFQNSFIYRLFIASIFFIIFIIGICFFCEKIIFVSADFVQFNLWMSKTSEVAKIYNTPSVVYFTAFPIVFSLLGIIRSLRFSKEQISSTLLMLALGLLLYSLLMAFIIRAGISSNAYFIMFMALYIASFEQIKRPAQKECILFIVLVLLFLGSVRKADIILLRFKAISYDYLYEKYKNNPDLKDVPEKYLESFKEKLKSEQEAENNYDEKGHLKKSVKDKGKKEKESKPKEDTSFICGEKLPEKIIKKIRADRENGSIWVDIFTAPEVLWETRKPVYSGPYHTNLQGLRDLFAVQLDNSKNFEVTKRIFKKRNTTQVMMKNPRCFNYLFYDEKTGKFKEGLKNFYYSVYYETKQKPNWIGLEYVDEKSQIKIFRVLSEKLK